MKPLKWKILIPIVVLAVLALIALSYYFQSSVNSGLLLSIIPIASPFIFYALDYYQKAKVNLKIETAEFIEKTIDNQTGYLLKVGIANRGKKICLNVNAKFNIKDAQDKDATLTQVRIESNYGNRTVTTAPENFDQVGYWWLKPDGKQIVVKELRQNDPYYLLFPIEHSVGFAVNSHSVSYDCFLSLNNGKYVVEVELKGEDPERNTVIKKRTFNLSVANRNNTVAPVQVTH